MMLPRIPYVEVPTLSLDLPLAGEITLGIFGLLVATGIAVGSRLVTRYGRQRGLDPHELQRLITGCVVVGLACAHWVAVLGYHPGRVAADPWVLIRFFDGISSVGGFMGGVIAFAWLTRTARDRWSLADAIVYGLVAGFGIGRLGCALVHDHPGALVDPHHPLAVGPWPDGSVRLDLGLVEVLGMSVLACITYIGRWRTPGRLTLTIAGLYAVGRFWLDHLRAVDIRHGGLTVAQWAMLALLVLCVAAWRSQNPGSSVRGT